MKPFLLSIAICISIIVNAQIFPIGHRSINFRDASRSGGFSINGATTVPTGGTGRNIGTEVYYPATSAGDNTPLAAGTFPVVIIGHGFAMTWDAYTTLTDSLVRSGYIVALPRTEGGLLPAPSHLDFGKDLAKVADLIEATGSPFIGKTTGRIAIGGHSMGGGATFLSDAFAPASVKCYFTFAAAETNPSAVSAAAAITRPHLVFAGTYDCVAPPAQHQDLMYNALNASVCKTYIKLTKAYHCAFADNNFNCGFGEGTCITAGGLSSTAQQGLVRRYLNPYLDYYLKGSCPAWTTFDNLLDTITVGTVQQTCNVTVPSNPSISGPSSFCNGGSATLTAEPAGFSYVWNDNSTASSLNATAAGTYSVVVGNGTCSLNAVSVSVAENFPPTSISSITGNDTVCSGIAGITFSVPNQQGVTFNWSVPGGWTITSPSNTNSITVTAGNTTGDVTVTAQNNCGTTPSVQKNVTVVPSTLGTPGNITGNTSLCSNQSGWYSISPVSGATSYNWNVPNNWISSSVDSTAIQLTPPTGSSSTQISVSAANTCGNSTASTFNITLKQSPQISAVNGPIQICQGNGAGTYYAAVELDVDSFQWNIPSGWSFVGTDNTPTPIINITSSGTLTVNGYNECGTVQFQLPIAVTDTPQPVAVIQGNGVSCTTSGSSYQWYFNGNLIPNETGQSIANVTSSGNYSVVVTDNNGCVGTSQSVNYNIISVGDISDNSIIEIYPNPINSGDFLQIRISAVVDEKMLQLCYLDGRVLSSQSAHAGLNQLSTKNLAQGVYLLRYDSVVEKIVVR